MRIPHPRGDAILAHWAARAGIPVEAFSHAGISIISWNARKQRVLIYRTDSDAVILAPEPLADCLRGWLSERPTGTEARTEELTQAQPSLGLRFLWRDLISYLPETCPLPAPPSEVCRLRGEHTDLLRTLHDVCSEEDCKLGEVEIDHPVVLGYVEQGRLLGAASYIFDPLHPIADIGVLVRPEARLRGIARILVAALCAPEYAEGRVIQYTTQGKNVASQLVAKRIGFRLCLQEEGLEIDSGTPRP